MICVIPLLLFVSNALALPSAEKKYYDLADAERHFADFMKEYGKEYATEDEYNNRFEIFKEHLVNINYLNDMHESFYAVNEFSDISYEEFERTRHGLIPSGVKNSTGMVTVKKEWIENAPASLDYRDQNLVTPVKNQKACGGCFAFAAIGNIEGQYAKKHQQLISLSEQQALDCDTIDAHCNGSSDLVTVMRELVKQGGSEREEDYPYEAQDNTCRTDKSKIAVKVVDAQEIKTPTAEELKGALAQYGPLSVALNASPLTSDYNGGVLSPAQCSPDYLNHAVLLVGYATENKEGGKKYWIVKNSWGASWGDKGYFYMEEGFCGLGMTLTACAQVE